MASQREKKPADYSYVGFETGITKLHIIRGKTNESINDYLIISLVCSGDVCT